MFAAKRVLITGGAQGLGRATVEKFQEAGATVTALDVNGECLAKLSSDLPGVKTILVDLLDWDASTAEVEKAGPFDHLVNNAGVCRITPFMSISTKDVDFIFGVNFKAALNVSQAFAKGVVDAGITGATIVNVCSTGDKKVFEAMSVYCCSKAALTMMTKCMAKELGPHGIRVNCIRPSAMNTPLFETVLPGLDFETLAAPQINACAIKRGVEPSEAADLILFLSGPNSGMITGEDVAIDGGFSIY